MLETQDWWAVPGVPVEGMSQHVHLSTCFPLDQPLRVIVPLDMHVQLHMNPGTLNEVDVSVFGDSLDVNQVAALPNYRCPTAQCDLWYHLDYDTTRVPVDGYLEFRFHAKVTSPDGTDRLYVHRVVGDPGQRRRSTRPQLPNAATHRGARLVHGHGLRECTAHLEPAERTGFGLVDLRRESRQGVRRIDPSPTCSSRSIRKFHAEPVDRGRVIFEQNAQYKGPITIDTTTLSDGPHRLFLRTDATIASGTGSGAMVIPFRVQNGPAAAAMRLGQDVFETPVPIMTLVVVLFALVMNLPRRRPSARSATSAGDMPTDPVDPSCRPTTRSSPACVRRRRRGLPSTAPWPILRHTTQPRQPRMTGSSRSIGRNAGADASPRVSPGSGPPALRVEQVEGRLSPQLVEPSEPFGDRAGIRRAVDLDGSDVVARLTGRQPGGRLVAIGDPLDVAQREVRIDASDAGHHGIGGHGPGSVLRPPGPRLSFADDRAARATAPRA